jgi:hypothetical protein
MKWTYIGVGAVLGATIILCVWTLVRSYTARREEGFQSNSAGAIQPNANLSPDLQANPQTCALMLSVRERTKGLLDKAKASNNTPQAETLTIAVQSIETELKKMNCAIP